MFEKKLTSFNPIETTMVDEIPLRLRSQFVKDQRRVALLMAGSVEDREELSDFLEMIGIKPYDNKDLHVERNKAKRVNKDG